MNIRKLNNEDQQALEAFLAKHIESSLFMLGNSRQAGLEYGGGDYQGDYYAAFSDDDMIAVLAHFWNGNLMMQIPEDALFEPLVRLFRQDVTRPIFGILGDDAQAEQLIRLLKLTDADYALNRAEGLYALALDDLRPQAMPDNTQCILVNTNHTELLTGWLTAYNIEAMGVADDASLAERVAQSVKRMVTGSATWLLLVDGLPVALSAFNAALPEIVQIGPVWTPPEHRNRGYARMLVAKTLEQAKQHGVCRAVLFTDTPAAIKAYKAIGFEQIGHYRLALLRNEHIL